MENKKSIRNIAKALAATIGFIAIAMPLTACEPTGSKDSPLVLATDVLDGNFNPFFYTSGNDGEIVGQTQIGMLSGDDNGQPLANWTEPCVAHAYSVVTTGDKEDYNGAGIGEDEKYENYYTDYYFALKDNIKFSDGTLLTKKDVMFNIYMYLDPSYAGSSTMYSVNIKGLSAYRTQSTNASEASSTDQMFAQMTETRINALRNWAERNNATWQGVTNEMRSDMEKIHELFKQELDSDWNFAMNADMEKDYIQYKDANGNLIFHENWEAFLEMYNVITADIKYRTNGEVGADGKNYYYELRNDLCGTDHRGCRGDHSKEALINYIYNMYFGEFDGNANSYKDKLYSVLMFSDTGRNFRDYVRSNVMKDYFDEHGGLVVKAVSGIEMLNLSEIPDKNGGKIALKDADGTQKNFDVLHIRINGVDPKAIQNFSFTVAPAHYYSYKAGDIKFDKGHVDENPYFGVEFSDSDFMSTVRVIHVPMGAGPYRAAVGETSEVPGKTETTKFYNGSTVYFERNEHFMLGAPHIRQLRYLTVNSSLLYDNIKQGTVHYASPSMENETLNKLKVQDKDILSYANAQNLGYGYIGINAAYVPNIWVRRAIMCTLNPNMCVAYYGGGENASVILRPMSKTLSLYYADDEFRDCKDYHYYPYGSASGTSLDDVPTADDNDMQGQLNATNQQRENAKKTAQRYLEEGGCYLANKGDTTLVDPISKKPLKLTFTIAGATDDHPAYNMLRNSAEILKDIGFDITLKQDSRALSLLSSGGLAVWAAAWSSSSDPDMYQVYHKDTRATSRYSWGYDYILSSTDTRLQTDKDILDELSQKIDEGRETDKTNERRAIYIEAQNLLMQLAVEFPTYQRQVYYVWRKGVFDESTLITGNDVTTYQSPLSRIWEVKLLNN